MIQVKDLYKRYAGQEAVRGISFNVEKGEIVGFLGPNGAGKSSTMRILTGYLPASEGEVKIAGFDLLNHSLEVRKRIGYMPENVPLYNDMRVSDFLEFRAALKGVKGTKKIRNRVSDTMLQCGISDVSSQIIGNLSKGYRQRVGLADALVHDPELLILDEPTAGLDPNQIRSVRKLIKELGENHTILLSTHILPEVEMICGRAVIINRGRIEAMDTLKNLSQRVKSGLVSIEIQAKKEEAVKKIESIDPVSEVFVRNESKGWLNLECAAKPGEDIREALDLLIKKEEWPLREFRREKANLEDVFVELTQE